MPDDARPHVVIVGGGFAGLAAAKSLAKARVRVTIVDQQNHHLFQPLLYQVATAALSPAQIAAPIRRVLSRQRNVRVVLAEATGVDVAGRRLLLTDGEIAYDTLVIAAGATHSYFGHDEWAKAAPGLKTVDDAIQIRRRFLLAFERAERETDATRQRAELTFVVVGGGPTGVEMAGAMAEIARTSIASDFRRIDTRKTRVVLVEASERLLGGFPKSLAARARRDLEGLGVEVLVSSLVVGIDDAGVVLRQADGREERLAARTVIWAAGVRGSSLGASLGAPLDRNGRVIVGRDLSVPGHPEVFVVGDLAYVIDPSSGEPVPGIAPGALQMGRYVGRLVAEEAAGRPRSERRSFDYINKGTMATIGRARAVADIRGVHVAGLAAWLLWAGIHVFYLVNFRTRLLVMLEWGWQYFFFERGARLITGKKAE